MPRGGRAAGGCHPNRDTEAAVRAAGFALGDLDRFGFAFSALAPRAAHVIGTATRP
ncbi:MULTISPECIES: hypothetical protein [unclassified Streptomyces]|uniref:hypothetical protein n=1 Tax=unclassified Streptomyces TaxID=2593676 RepID=UPI000A6796CA|nr:hypothetical protein [Streptomyces sp. CNQ-509]